MSNLSISIPHQLSQEEALQRVKTLLTNLQNEQRDRIKNVTEEWTGNTAKFGFTAQGFNVSGDIIVESGTATINAELPFALSFFKGMINQTIREKATALLS
jgi:hypothetical protein